MKLLYIMNSVLTFFLSRIFKNDVKQKTIQAVCKVVARISRTRKINFKLTSFYVVSNIIIVGEQNKRLSCGKHI